MSVNTSLLARFRQNPAGFIKRAIYKTFIGPLKYKRGDRYDAPRYWNDRFSKYGLSILGPGDEGLTEAQNNQMYEEAEKSFLDLCRAEGIDFSKNRVLEIGLGNGFYTEVLHRSGVREYQGLDIADVLFPNLRERFPGFRFAQKDITSSAIEGQYDVIFLIDVIQHIVTEEQLSFALQNISRCLSPKGVFIVGPMVKEGKKTLYYVHPWSIDVVRKHIPSDLKQSGPFAFRGAELFSFRG